MTAQPDIRSILGAVSPNKPIVPQAPTAGKKRARVDEVHEAQEDEFSLEEAAEMVDGIIMDKDCNQVRRMIHRVIDNGELKIGEFCDRIRVSNKSYNTFMNQSGATKGASTATFSNAWVYFKWREVKDIPLPTSATKKLKTDAAGRTASATAPKSSAAKSGAAKKNEGVPAAADLADMRLPGEATDSVEVYDSCDEVRKKLNAHLRKAGVTQVGFCRDLVAMYSTAERRPAKIQSKQLADFRGKKGPLAGNTSCVFCAAYCFFEKCRLKEGKPKSRHREEMERVWTSDGGVDTRRRRDGGYFCHASERPYEDEYGRVHFMKI